jgi:phosphatidylserine decarboxylase
MAAVFYTTSVTTRESVSTGSLDKKVTRLKGRRSPLIAREGIPVLLAAFLIAAFSWYYLGWFASIVPGIATASLFMLFRDPHRDVPALPLAAVCPVDGVIAEVTSGMNHVTNTPAHKIIIRINAFGTYTARAPVEGMILDSHGKSVAPEVVADAPGLWIRTDEGDDVLLRFHGNRFGLVPRAFSRYGERVGQGQRCANLRLARFAEVYLPVNSRVQVVAGQEVVAGRDVLGSLPHP